MASSSVVAAAGVPTTLLLLPPGFTTSPSASDPTSAPVPAVVVGKRASSAPAPLGCEKRVKPLG